MAATGRMYNLPHFVEQAETLRKIIRKQSYEGQIFVDNYDQDGRGITVADDVMGAVRLAYDTELIAARGRRQAVPVAARTLQAFKTVIGSKAQGVQPQS